MKMDIETVASELKLDRSNWSLTTFGKVAIQQKESVDRENTDITRYVKGEHMYSEDLHLREWGELKDEYLGPAFIRKFDEGDILYGSRRTYLRKVCIAPFTGITANTTFVIKANADLIDKRLLPFVMLSEGFSEHSIRNSKGSVNPYVNWKDLAGYEFLLPPKDQQAKLVELLWAMDDVIENEIVLLGKIKTQMKVEVNLRCCPEHIADNFKTIRLSKIVKNLVAGVSVNCDKEYSETDECVLKTSAITGEYFDPKEAKIVLGKDLGKLKSPLKPNKILINRKNTRGLIGSSKFIDRTYDNLYLPDLIWELEVDEELASPKFIWYLLSSGKLRAKISALSNGTNESMVNISQSDFLNITISIPSLVTQRSDEVFLSEIESSKDICRQKVSSSRSLLKSLINQVF